MRDYRLVVDGVDLDIDENVSFPLNFSIADVTKPNQRQRNRSLTIALPGTRSNMVFFSSIWNLSLTDLSGTAISGFKFDPTQRSEAKYYQGGEVVFDGLMQLVSIKKHQGYTFEVLLFSNFIDLFDSVKDLNISDLGWSEYDHELNRTNIALSWDTSVDVNGTPTSNFTSNVPDAFGYLYGLVDWGHANVLDQISTTDVVPMVYWREVMEKIFAVGGFTYSSSFLDSEVYKRLLISFEGGDKIGLSSGEIASRLGDLDADLDYALSIQHQSIRFVDTLTTDYYQVTYTAYDYRSFDELLSSITFNNGGYDSLDSDIRYNVPQKGTYKIQVSGTLVCDLDFSSAVTNPNLILHDVQLLIRRNGAIVFSVAQQIPLGTPTNFVLDVDNDFKFWNSDQISFEILTRTSAQIQEAATGSEPTLDWTIADDTNGIEITISCVDGVITDGDTVQISRYLPELKCSDFLMANIKAFNLYVSEPDAFGVITVEPLDDYYPATTVRDDWTQLLDHDMPQEIIPAGSIIEAKRHNFKWKPDKDYYNEQYRDQYLIGYGDHTYTVESTFQDNDMDYQLPFAQSVPVEIKSGYILPRIIKVDPTTGAVTPFKGSARVFCYNGLVTADWRLYDDSNTASFDDLSTYPQMNHLQDLTNADFDLNFAPPEVVLWTITAYTDQNMFKYHEKSLREVTSRDSKILKAYFKLSTREINQAFSRFVMINGVLFKKNRILNYDGINKQTTPVELLRVIEGDSPAVTGINVYVPPKEPGGGNFVPSVGRINSQYRGVRVITSDELVQQIYLTYIVDTSTGNVLLNFPDATTVTGMLWHVKLIDVSNTLTVRAFSGQTIEGVASINLTTLDEFHTYYSDGSNFIEI